MLRVSDAAVIPIYLDDTLFPGIPKDIVGIVFKNYQAMGGELQNRITDDIVFKLLGRLADD